MANNKEFRNVNNEFQEKLKNVMNNIRMCNKILITAVSSRNLCKLGKDQYESLLKEKFTKPTKSEPTKRLRT